MVAQEAFLVVLVAVAVEMRVLLEEVVLQTKVMLVVVALLETPLVAVVVVVQVRLALQQLREKAETVEMVLLQRLLGHL